MNTLMAIAMLTAVLAMMPAISYSEILDYEVHGWGYGLTDIITDASLQLDLMRETNSNRATFEQGQISVGDNAQQISRLDMIFLQNERILRISGSMSDGTMVAATGRLLAINEHGAIYDLRGNVVKNDVLEKIFLYVTLQQRQKTESSPEIAEDANVIARQDALLLVKHNDVVEWKSKYEFTARVFDPNTNLGSNFYHSFGFLKGVKITAKITNPAGNLINTINGTTDSAGYFVGSMIIPDNSLRGAYRLDIQIADDAFQTKSEQLFFTVIPV